MSAVWVLQQISQAFQHCKNFENLLRFDKVTESLKVGTLFETWCSFAKSLSCSSSSLPQRPQHCCTVATSDFTLPEVCRWCCHCPYGSNRSTSSAVGQEVTSTHGSVVAQASGRRDIGLPCGLASWSLAIWPKTPTLWCTISWI